MSTVHLEEQLKQAAVTAQEEEKRSNEEADRLSKETKRLREEADRIEAESTRHRRTATEANRLKQSLKFDALCFALRRNDSSITELPLDWAMPTGYAQPLGNALRGNTCVAALTLHLESCLPDEIHDDSTDDGNEDGNDDDDHPLNEKAIKKLCAPIVRFLSKSQGLSRLCLSGAHDNERVNQTLVELIFGACFRNSKIKDLDVASIAVPASLLQSCFRSSSLKSLKLDFTDTDNYTDSDQDAIRDSFSTFSCLSTLNMVIDDCSLAIAILLGLRRVGVPLEEIELDCVDMEVTQAFWPTLTTFLRSAQQLKRLLFGGLDFDGTCMQDVLVALKERVYCTPLTKLAFDSCEFFDGAPQALCDLMKSAVEPTDSTIALREFIVDTSGGDGLETLSARTLLSMIVVPEVHENRLLVGAEGVLSRTIGSQIQSLTVDPVISCPHFLPRLARQERQINLSELFVTQLSNTRDAVALAQCISKMRSLRSLKVSYVSTSFRPIVASLRTNGHIQAFSLKTSFFTGPPLEKEFRLAQAYCERNQFLDDLLQKATNLEPSQTEGSPSESSDDMLLYPALAEAAMQIPSTRPATLLRTLLALHDSVGFA